MKDVVSTLYDKLLTDKETRDFFLGVDLQKVKLHEAQYLLNLIGGSVKYEGREIKIAHKPINLTDRHFYIYKKHINDALRYHKVDSDIIDQILFLIEKKRTELMDRKTPYEIVGGAYGVRRIVDRMYEMIPNHPSLKHYFEDMNIEAIKAAQMKFISSILDGPAYIGKDMKTIHGKMNLADGHFDAFKGCFEIALVEMNLKKDEIRDCTYALEKYRRDVCSISLFELLGGEHTVQKVAKAMAAKVRQNDILKGFYTYGDDDEVRATLRSEIMHALGGPLSFRERDIKSAHQGMFLKMEHFNEYKKLINESMKENGVVDNLIVQVIKILENKAYLIIDKKNPEDLKKQAVI